MDSYVYSKDEDKLKAEAEAACELGISAAFVKEIEIPVPCAGAVGFARQAQFHPLKFIEAIADTLTVYEDSPVKEVEEHIVRTPGGSVRAGKIIFAVHFPFVNFPGMYFARIHQERSYVLALENAGTLNGMYIGDGEDTLSFRQYERYVLLGGQGHRTGKNKEGGKYAALRESAKRLYPDSTEAAYWSAQDCVTADQVPFIGTYAKEPPGLAGGHRFPQMGDEFFHGGGNAHPGYALRERQSLCANFCAVPLFRRGASPDRERQRDGGQGSDKALLPHPRRGGRTD